MMLLNSTAYDYLHSILLKDKNYEVTIILRNKDDELQTTDFIINELIPRTHDNSLLPDWPW